MFERVKFAAELFRESNSFTHLSTPITKKNVKRSGFPSEGILQQAQGYISYASDRGDLSLPKVASYLRAAGSVRNFPEAASLWAKALETKAQEISLQGEKTPDQIHKTILSSEANELNARSKRWSAFAKPDKPVGNQSLSDVPQIKKVENIDAALGSNAEKFKEYVELKGESLYTIESGQPFTLVIKKLFKSDQVTTRSVDDKLVDALREASNFYELWIAEQFIRSHYYQDKKEIKHTPIELPLVKVNAKYLGFDKPATFQEIFDKAWSRGYTFCPPEVGPYLRLAYDEVANDKFAKEKDTNSFESYLIAMKPLTNFAHGGYGGPYIFEIFGMAGNSGGQLKPFEEIANEPYEQNRRSYIELEGVTNKKKFDINQDFIFAIDQQPSIVQRFQPL